MPTSTPPDAGPGAGDPARFVTIEDNGIPRALAMGRESAIGRFRLGGFGETPLRVGREDGSDFTDDEIYNEIRKRLDQFAERLTDKPDNRFINPFVGAPAAAFNAKSIGLSHPLGGCRMAGSSQDGVCDEFGRVFDSTGSDANTVYPGVYIADGARIPTALGVNPSLTIAALALRTADTVIEEVRTQARPDA